VSARRRKYNAEPTYYGGERYPSRGEAGYARRLDLLKAAGAIHDWRRGGEWALLDSPTGKQRDGIAYRPDFEVWDTPDGGGFRVVDFKGVVTREFRLKAKLWKARYPDVPLVVAWADGAETRL
jgi:Protein of unknown function (DUF1064)